MKKLILLILAFTVFNAQAWTWRFWNNTKDTTIRVSYREVAGAKKTLTIKPGQSQVVDSGLMCLKWVRIRGINGLGEGTRANFVPKNRISDPQCGSYDLYVTIGDGDEDALRALLPKPKKGGSIGCRDQQTRPEWTKRMKLTVRAEKRALKA